MISCAKPEEPAVAIAYLRQDVLTNDDLILALERNMPSVPRDVWMAAQDDSTVVGVMMLQDFVAFHPDGQLCVSLRVTLPAALPALLTCLAPASSYQFVVPTSLREMLLAEVDEATSFSESVYLSIAANDLRLWDSPGEVRRLTIADKALTDRFPIMREHEPPLSRLVAGAEEDPENAVVFGAIADGEVAAYVRFGRETDNIWDAHIWAREEYRRRGFGKAVLSHAGEYLLRRGVTPTYSVNAENIASLRTAQAAGFHEVFRRFSCRGRLR
jgi:ribosomal protein S18 acetylase RimI-like enzyme